MILFTAYLCGWIIPQPVNFDIPATHCRVKRNSENDKPEYRVNKGYKRKE